MSILDWGPRKSLPIQDSQSIFKRQILQNECRPDNPDHLKTFQKSPEPKPLKKKAGLSQSSANSLKKSLVFDRRGSRVTTWPWRLCVKPGHRTLDSEPRRWTCEQASTLCHPRRRRRGAPAYQTQGFPQTRSGKRCHHLGHAWSRRQSTVGDTDSEATSLGFDFV